MADTARNSVARQMRQVWIDAKLGIGDGTINRSDLVVAFGISIQQASHDLAAYRASNPKAVDYDLSAKCYRRTKRGKPAYPQHLRLSVTNAVRALRIFNEMEESEQ
ncbi:hypothetical protein SAMN06265173_13538 [Thalassovita litoralis]|uniref:DNA-binding transcriptional repressor CapW winged helix-turn-helix domain-containing protein n=1 Tax=Thalassovita litoralis TaxID=1010611 RepID=A0A521FP19_9RHOB|nr:hypothetical protein [Thalassovita litoralis]SMO97211.1 hypothetical protein SAMN06265173_13538 [Thalassovita litoralis]